VIQERGFDACRIIRSFRTHTEGIAVKNIYITRVALILALFAGSAFAADLPSRKAPPYAPPPPPPPPLWTGFYAGLNAGGTWSESNSVTTSAGVVQFCRPDQICGAGAEAAAMSALGASGVHSLSNSGFIGGGQIGYNWQFNNVFVVGLEADIQGVAGANGSANSASVASVPTPTSARAATIGTALSVTKSLDYLGTVRGRLGYLVTPTLLAYATGGLAYGGVSSSTNIFQSGLPGFGNIALAFGSAGDFSDTRFGYTVGGGLEWMFLPNWSAKLEYLYYDLGNVSYSGGQIVDPILNPTSPIVPPTFFINAVRATTRFDGHIVRAGVNYHFNFGRAPTVAGY